MSAELETALQQPQLALYGGTFDPVHLGHVHIATEAADMLDLDTVLFTPALSSPHKQGRETASGSLRAELLALATAHDPRFCVWDVELTRAGPSFTVDTIRTLRDLRGEGAGEPFLILGLDQLPAFDRWHEVEQVLELSRPIVIDRGGDHGVDPSAEFDRLEAALPRRLASLLRRGYLPLEEPHPASATEIRRALAAGEAPEHLDPAVRARIAELELYA